MFRNNEIVSDSIVDKGGSINGREISLRPRESESNEDRRSQSRRYEEHASGKTAKITGDSEAD